MKHKGILIVVSGFSGAGKGTLMKQLVHTYDDYALSISMTTRSPRPGEEEGFEPTFFVTANTNYECKYPPRIFLVSGDNAPALMGPENVGLIDTIRVASVDAVLNVRVWERGKTLYVNTMYVVQDLASDPFAGKYMR